MTAYQRALNECLRLGMDFDAQLAHHMAHGYVWCSPDSFILALPGYRIGDAFDGISTGQGEQRAWFITLAVGSVQEFVNLDPVANKQWLGFCREDGGRIHWLRYDKLRRKNSACLFTSEA